jgi:hypothetical protein
MDEEELDSLGRCLRESMRKCRSVTFSSEEERDGSRLIRTKVDLIVWGILGPCAPCHQMAQSN